MSWRSQPALPIQQVFRLKVGSHPTFGVIPLIPRFRTAFGLDRLELRMCSEFPRTSDDV